MSQEIGAREVAQMLLRYSEMVGAHAALAQLTEEGSCMLREEAERAQAIAGQLYAQKGRLDTMSEDTRRIQTLFSWALPEAKGFALPDELKITLIAADGSTVPVWIKSPVTILFEKGNKVSLFLDDEGLKMVSST